MGDLFAAMEDDTAPDSTQPTGAATAALFEGPVKRPLEPDDPFFEAGDLQRALLCKMSVFAIDHAQGDADEQGTGVFTCHIGGCCTSFSSIQRYEAHYETTHRHRCSVCGHALPTARLLDFHISELHDSFFKAQAVRLPMYCCLVEGCQDVFHTPRLRQAHLTGHHRYPRAFDFHRPAAGARRTAGEPKARGGAHHTGYRRGQRPGGGGSGSGGGDGVEGGVGSMQEGEVGSGTDEKMRGSDSYSRSSDMLLEAHGSGGELPAGDVCVGRRRGGTSGGGGGGSTGPRENGSAMMEVEVHRAPPRGGDGAGRAGSGVAGGKQKQHATLGGAVERCRYYVTAGGCRKGEACRFKHEGSPRRACRYYNTTPRGCRKGNQCPYRHDDAGGSAPPPQARITAGAAGTASTTNCRPPDGGRGASQSGRAGDALAASAAAAAAAAARSAAANGGDTELDNTACGPRGGLQPSPQDSVGPGAAPGPAGVPPPQPLGRPGGSPLPGQTPVVASAAAVGQPHCIGTKPSNGTKGTPGHYPDPGPDGADEAWAQPGPTDSAGPGARAEALAGAGAGAGSAARTRARARAGGGDGGLTMGSPGVGVHVAGVPVAADVGMEGVPVASTAAETGMDVDVDDLVERVGRVRMGGVPERLCFGRSRRGGRGMLAKR